jgi:hypothetical protein
MNEFENRPAKKFVGALPGKNPDPRRVHENEPELRCYDNAVRRQLHQSAVAFLALSDSFENPFFFVHVPLPFRYFHEKASTGQISGITVTSDYNKWRRASISSGATTLKPLVMHENA